MHGLEEQRFKALRACQCVTSTREITILAHVDELLCLEGNDKLRYLSQLDDVCECRRTPSVQVTTTKSWQQSCEEGVGGLLLGLGGRRQTC